MFSDDLHINRLVFRRCAIDGAQSISFALPASQRRGIYIYQYRDGTCYVGKSVDMVGRYDQHRHEWRHDDLDQDDSRIQSALFATVESDDPAVLDQAETDTILACEQRGMKLRNKAKTSMPLGPDTATIDLDGGDVQIALPWVRAERPRSTSYALEPASDPQRKKFERLSRLEAWPQLRRVLSHYVAETIPAPGPTAGRIWSATAFPSTNESQSPRLVTISCQNIETLVIGRDLCDFSAFVNGKMPEGWEGANPGFECFHEYKSAQDVQTLYFESLDEVECALYDSGVLEWCYRLNVEMLRKGGCMYARFNNPLLAEAILV